MENLYYKNENTEKKYLENMQNNQFLKVKNSLLELEKDFKELKDRELKDIEEIIKRELEMEIEMKKIRSIKRNWFDWLIKQSVMGKKAKIIRDKLKDKIINDTWTLFETEEEKEDREKRSKRKE